MELVATPVIDSASSLVIGVTTPIVALEDQALDLAQELALPFISDPVDPGFTYLLVLTQDRLALHSADSAGPVYVDFTRGVLRHRRRFGGGRGQSLAKAVGLKGGNAPHVLDATAGLGRDGFILGCLGCRVQLLERSSILAALLRQGLQQAALDDEIGAWVKERLHLTRADSRVYMAALQPWQRPDVVYLDPMYPHRGKSALVKKEMRILRRLVGDDADADELLAAALRCARRRVVVKRPRLAPTLQGPKPDAMITAKNTRFDIYLNLANVQKQFDD